MARLRGWSKYEPLKFARPVMSDEVGTAFLRVGSRDCSSGTWQRPGYLKRVILAPTVSPLLSTATIVQQVAIFNDKFFTENKKRSHC
jgi:hypothetical protein